MQPKWDCALILKPGPTVHCRARFISGDTYLFQELRSFSTTERYIAFIRELIRDTRDSLTHVLIPAHVSETSHMELATG